MSIEVPFPVLFVLFLSVWISIRRKQYRKDDHAHRFHREVALSLLFLYITAVFYITFHPFHFYTPDMVPFTLHWEPFKEILDQFDRSPRLAVYYALGNIAMTIPFGFMVAFLLPHTRTFWKIFMYGITFSLAIETMQFLFTYRSAEIDDIIFNTLGALIGYCCFIPLHALLHRMRC